MNFLFKFSIRHLKTNKNQILKMYESKFNFIFEIEIIFNFLRLISLIEKKVFYYIVFLTCIVYIIVLYIHNINNINTNISISVCYISTSINQRNMLVF